MPTNPAEIFPIVDINGRIVGKASRGECHSGSKLLHPVIHLQLFNSQGMIYLQKRSVTKEIQPGKWDTAVGGHIDFGETKEVALRRETREELGIVDFQPVFIHQYVFESEIERELVYTFFTIYDGNITPDNDEVECGRFWSIQEIERSLGQDIFTPNFENEYYTILQRLLSSR
ncbi:MAG: NUDIX domain-containing protein [Porphyromonadaceae bacterium]|nr:NUDIX domain-containing protein [Porphyromonadaceae bacterium]